MINGRRNRDGATVFLQAVLRPTCPSSPRLPARSLELAVGLAVRSVSGSPAAAAARTGSALGALRLTGTALATAVAGGGHSPCLSLGEL